MPIYITHITHTSINSMCLSISLTSSHFNFRHQKPKISFQSDEKSFKIWREKIDVQMKLALCAMHTEIFPSIYKNSKRKV